MIRSSHWKSEKKPSSSWIGLGWGCWSYKGLAWGCWSCKGAGWGC